MPVRRLTSRHNRNLAQATSSAGGISEFVRRDHLAFAGLAVQALVSYCVAFVTVMVLFRVMAVLSLLNREMNLIKPSIILGSVVLFLILSARGALRHRYGLDYSQTKVSLRSAAASGEVLKALAMLISEILFAGPRLLFVGAEHIVQAIRQWRADCSHLAPMIRWLLERETKVPISELTASFEGNTSSLRDVPGVIWLAKDAGVVIVSEELKKELQMELQKRQKDAR